MPSTSDPQHGEPTGALVSLTAVHWDFGLIGRTRMLTEAWHRDGQSALFVEPPHSYRSLIKSFTRKPASPEHVVRPWPTRYPVRWWTRMDIRRLNKMMRDRAQSLRRRLERKCSLSDSCAVVVSPMWTPWLDAIRFGRVVYDCIDDLSVHAPDSGFLRLYQMWENDLIDRCDAGVVTAEVLRTHIASRRPQLPIETIRNGVDYERFVERAATSPRPTDLPPPGDKPVVGFVGALYEWIDWPLIRAAAQGMSEFQFVFVGPHNQPAEIEQLSKLPNVALLGPKPYDQVPAYVSAFDVCWVPFRSGDIAQAANPVKIYEYLALGKPVVTTPVADTGSFGDTVFVARSDVEAIRAIQRAIESRSADQTVARREFARRNSWQQRSCDYLQFISKLPQNLRFD